MIRVYLGQLAGMDVQLGFYPAKVIGIGARFTLQGVTQSNIGYVEPTESNRTDMEAVGEVVQEKTQDQLDLQALHRDVVQVGECIGHGEIAGGIGSEIPDQHDRDSSAGQNDMFGGALVVGATSPEHSYVDAPDWSEEDRLRPASPR